MSRPKAHGTQAQRVLRKKQGAHVSQNENITGFELTNQVGKYISIEKYLTSGRINTMQPRVPEMSPTPLSLHATLGMY